MMSCHQSGTGLCALPYYDKAVGFVDRQVKAQASNFYAVVTEFETALIKYQNQRETQLIEASTDDAILPLVDDYLSA